MAPKPGTRVKWYRSPVPRDQLSQLNRRSNLKGLAQTGGFIAVLVATGSLCVHASFHWPWWTWLPLLLLHGAVSNFTVNGVHELIHESVFRTRWLNRPFLHLLSFYGWINHVWFWTSHTEHHKYTLHPPDDLEVIEPELITPRGLLLNGIIQPMGLWNRIRSTTLTAFRRPTGPWSVAAWTDHLFPEDDTAARRAYRNFARIILLGHGLIVIVSLATGWWMLAIVLSTPHIFGAGLQMLCNLAQHAGLKDNTPDYRICCRTIHLNPVLQFLYWHMNYHTEHHMYAAVPCYNLGRLHRLIRHDLPECPRGLIATWRQIFAIVRRQQLDPDFRFVPVLPTPGPDPSPPTPLHAPAPTAPAAVA